MAGLTTVLDALAQGLGAALYPNGIAQPSAVGVDCTVFPGWPDPASLDADLKRGAVQVSVFPRTGMARVEGRRLDGWVSDERAPPTMTASIAGAVVTFSGTGSPGQIAAIVEPGVKAWTTPATGTPAATAAALAALIQADRAATLSGASLTLPGALKLRARVVAQGTERLTIRRQSQPIQITVWAPTPALRSAVAEVLDLWVGTHHWLALPADESARVTYAGLAESDEGRLALLHRRDLMIAVDYPTVARRAHPGVAVVETDIGPIDPPGAPISVVVLT